ncbi:alpha/beta hydrolase [Streptomyces sp. SID5470]|nr:alpha/beta hydrolase [Streptomyces sp. SID5470]
MVCIHGIGQQYTGERELLGSWYPALTDGLTRADRDLAISEEDVSCVFYGDLFRPPGRALALQDPPLDAFDVAEGFETDLLLAFWAEAARTDEGVVPPDARTLVRTPRQAQRALNVLSRSRFFAGVAMRALVLDLKQVRTYLCDRDVAAAIRQRVAAAVTERTRVVVGHSLGSVVAYEALCANPDWPVRALLTLGSPLGIRNLVYDRLRVGHDGKPGSWPGRVERWTNIADEGDVVALVKDLRPLFGPRVDCHLVHNGARAHDVTRYLNTPQAGRAVLDGFGSD